MVPSVCAKILESNQRTSYYSPWPMNSISERRQMEEGKLVSPFWRVREDAELCYDEFVGSGVIR